jgi:ribosomal protection tetracycline resistance protein
LSSLNLGILAHVDAGKTSLTERLLFTAGVIATIGRVDHGSTTTDSLDLERRRGITIKSAVVSFPLRGTTVNLIDTPGHPDFIAEVERVLGVLDGAVLVVSAVEGVQAQTRVLLRTLHRLAIPTLIFVNKIDRPGARTRSLLDEIAARLGPRIIGMSVVEGGTVRPAPDLMRLADHDEDVLAAFVDGRPLPAPYARGDTHPVYFGSAITGAGIDDLIGGITTLLPPAAAGPAENPSGTIFKIDRGPAGEKRAYLRMFAGTVRVRDTAGPDRITGIELFRDGGLHPVGALRAGEIGLLRGLSQIKIGDPLGVRAPAAPHPHSAPQRHSAPQPHSASQPGSESRQHSAPQSHSGAQPHSGPQPGSVARAHFAPPSLEATVVPRRRSDRGALHAALAELAEQDPLINLRGDDVVSLYGEVQKEVIEATLADEYGLAVSFEATTTLCIERLAGCGSAYELNKVAPNPFLATVGLRAEPAPPGAGVSFRLAVEPGSMPPAFFKAVEETVAETLRQGLYGWPVPDCAVTLTRSGYSARQSHSHAVFDKSMSSTAGDFRNLTPLVLTEALRRAGTTVLEPIHAFTAEVPPDTVPAVLPVLARLRAVPLATTGAGISGEIPAARVHDLVRALPGLTRGEGVLENAFDHYEPVRGTVPVRRRTDANPLDRKEYLLRVLRRAGSREQP